MSQKANVIRKALTRQGFIVDSVEWKPFKRSASQDEDTGGWKAETTCKGCGLHQTFGGLSIEEVLYTIESIACIVCQTLKIDIARLVATYQPIPRESKMDRFAELYKMINEGKVIIPPMDFLRGREMTLDVMDDAFTYATSPVQDAFDAVRPREPVDDGFGPSTTYQLAPYKHWYYPSIPDNYLLTLNHERLRCSSCKAPCNPNDPSWRATGYSYEHKCPENHPLAGYFAAEPIESSKE